MLRCESKRKGFFVIGGDRRAFSLAELEALFAGFVPVQVEINVMLNESRFWGYSRHFREIDEGLMAYEYFPTITKLDDGAVKVTWRCALDPEPTPGISEPDYDRIRRAVEIVIKQHELEWRKQSEAFKAQYRIEFGGVKDALDRLLATEIRRHIAPPGFGFLGYDLALNGDLAAIGQAQMRHRFMPGGLATVIHPPISHLFRGDA